MIDLSTDTLGISRLYLNRPEKHNAFGPELMKQITEALTTLAAKNQTRVLIITGAGKSFSSGADLNYMKSMIDFSHRENVQDAGRLANMLKCINEFPCPVIAAVNGNAIAGATGIIAASDLVIAASDARFSISEVRFGIAPAVISPYVIARIGVHNARRFFLTAEVFDAQTARHAGLVHHIVEPEQLMAEAVVHARNFLNNGPRAMSATKALIRRIAPVHVDPAVTDHTCELIAQLRASDEGQQGLNAFFTRLPAPWIPDGSS